MSGFHNTRLPADVERGARGGPGFSTSIASLASGHEQRNIRWSEARSSWNIGYGIRRREDFDAVYAFFLNRRGRGYAFRYKDWLDFKASNEPVGIVSGDDTRRRLIKTYNDEVTSYVRLVVLPVQETLVVYVNGIATIDYVLEAGGIIRFPSNPGAVVHASFEFDIPARFDIDQIDIALNTYREGTIPDIPVVEVMLPTSEYPSPITYLAGRVSAGFGLSGGLSTFIRAELNGASGIIGWGIEGFLGPGPTGSLVGTLTDQYTMQGVFYVPPNDLNVVQFDGHIKDDIVGTKVYIDGQLVHTATEGTVFEYPTTPQGTGIEWQSNPFVDGETYEIMLVLP